MHFDTYPMLKLLLNTNFLTFAHYHLYKYYLMTMFVHSWLIYKLNHLLHYLLFDIVQLMKVIYPSNLFALHLCSEPSFFQNSPSLSSGLKKCLNMNRASTPDMLCLCYHQVHMSFVNSYHWLESHHL